MNKNKYIARACQDNQGNWLTHSLNDHLCDTAQRARDFAQTFNNADWAELAGKWHDLGKYLPKWQNYIRRQTGYDADAHIEGYDGRPNHSTIGAIISLEKSKFSPVGRILAYIIAGHHAGLPDWNPDVAGGDLINRLFSDPLAGIIDASELNQIRNLSEIHDYLSEPLPKSVPLSIKNPDEMVRNSEHFHLWIRILFSCLVDADCLDSEKFMKPEQSAQRGQHVSLKVLSKRFDKYMEIKQTGVELKTINRSRKKIFEQCKQKAQLPSGFFSLTVPTGGGKTLSAMAFALRHALEHGKQRIISAIPYTSIIEQTAKVYKYGSDDEEEIKKAIDTGEMLFGEDDVLEHHSNIDPDKEDNNSKLASENWDAPIIVTTNVQLFESLLGSRTSSCRKLHNIVNSVIILDEAQMLPPEYLKPIISILKGLVEHFGCTVLLCTATQPSLCGNIGHGQAAFVGLEQVTEIIENKNDWADAFKRVEIVPPNLESHTEWISLAKELQEYESVLCIVNTRRDCRELHSLMPTGTVHLSANMCGEERSEIISEIKLKLRKNEPVRVISTQLVEAGVDIDFPVVYRALAGVDSIAQAAGRCNREAKLNAQGKLGKVIIFQPPKPAPSGLLRKGEDAARTIIRNNPKFELKPEIFLQYFKQFYSSINDFDKPHFQDRLLKEASDFKFQFRTFAQDVRLVDDTAQRGIIVRYLGRTVDSNQLIGWLNNKGAEPWVIRKLQRFIVNVPIYLFNKLCDAGHISEVHGYWVQQSTGLYRPGYGLLSDIRDWDNDLFII